MSRQHIIHTWITLEVVLGVVLLISGCAIYLLFRDKSLNIYQWCVALGLSDAIDNMRFAVQDWNVAEWIRFCLPDGLYCAAYILIIDAIWHNDNRPIKFIIISLVPIVTISSELLQYIGLVKGTFDVYDLVCYALPPTLYICIIYVSFKFNKLRESRI